MKSLAALCVGACALMPAYSFAGPGTVVCGAVHFIRAAGTEARGTVIGLRNLDLVNSAIVERITIRNAFGDVIHDSGPAAGVPHPLNPDFSPALDITFVPPGASYYLATNHIWLSGEVPSPQTGQNMAATVHFSKEGKPGLFQVSATSRARDRSSGAERSRAGHACTEVNPSE